MGKASAASETAALAANDSKIQIASKSIQWLYGCARKFNILGHGSA
jgi:hypothetical protein